MARRFNGYIDIHTHILPYIDDGAADVKMTIDMIQQAHSEGIRKIVCTPHYGSWNPKYDPEYARLVFTKIRDAVKRIYPEMDMYFGNEIFYTHSIADAVREGKAATIADTSYVLVEFDPRDLYSKIEQGVREFTQAGYWPIIAHVERYECLRNEPERVADLIKFGAYIQVNVQTLMVDKKLFTFDKFQRMQQSYYNFAINLMKDGKVHFIASDCHNMDSRKPMMDEAAEVIEDVVGFETARDITYRNVGKMLKGERL